jgi:hypothetical protein
VTDEFLNLILFFLILTGLSILQNRLHYEIQACLLLITRRIDIAMAIFAILFLPGVFIHEISHYVMAKILGVETVRFSLLPEIISDGRLRLGYVETIKTDILRDALIGLAPIAAGGSIIALILFGFLNFQGPWILFGSGESAQVVASINAAIRQPDFWLWFYAIFVISSTMFPSTSDRRAWLPLGIIGGALIGLGLLAGGGPWLKENLVPRAISFIRVITFVLGISALAHIGLLIPFWFLRKILSGIIQLPRTG